MPWTLKQELMDLPDMKTKSMVMDLIEREAAPDSSLPIMESIGFRLYTRLQPPGAAGVTRIHKPLSSGDLQPVYAGNEDIQAVSDMLNVSFDHYAEQLPAIFEIASGNKQPSDSDDKARPDAGWPAFF